MVNYLHFKQLLVTAASLIASVPTFAYDFEVDGIYYNKLSENTVEVTYEEKWNPTKSYTGDITIPKDINYKDCTYSIVAIGDSAFFECSTLTAINIPNGVVSIGREAFVCSGLNSIIFPESLITIKAVAFCGCSNLTSIELPNGITSVGEYAFGNCVNLESINIPESLQELPNNMFQWCSKLETIKIPEGIRIIGEYAFIGCDNLKAITFPSTIKQIKSGAFSCCYHIYEISIPDTKTWCEIEFEDIESNPINNYTTLYTDDDALLFGQLDVPQSVGSINDFAFAYYSHLVTFNIPEGVKSIGKFAFSWASNLTWIEKITDDIEYIGENAFSYCESLVGIHLPKAITSISDKTFYYCSGLSWVSIPEGVKSIGKYAFAECSKLEELICYSDNPPICEEYALSGISRTDCTLYVPESSIDTYKSTSPWSEFTNIVALEETGISDILMDEDKPTVIYDLNGRKLSEPKHGLNIINGKKVVVK